MAVDQKHEQTFKIASESLSHFRLSITKTGELGEQGNL